MPLSLTLSPLLCLGEREFVAAVMVPASCGALFLAIGRGAGNLFTESKAVKAYEAILDRDDGGCSTAWSYHR
jgi:hypothetical protein